MDEENFLWRLWCHATLKTHNNRVPGKAWQGSLALLKVPNLFSTPVHLEEQDTLPKVTVAHPVSDSHSGGEAQAGQAHSNWEESHSYLDDCSRPRHGGCFVSIAQGSKECSSKLAAHQNHLQDLLKHNAASVPRVSGSEDLGPKICISYKFPVGADAAALGTTLWESLIQKMDSTAHLTGSKYQLCHLVALWRSASDVVSVPQLSHL